MPLDYVNDTVGNVYTPPDYNSSPDAFGLSSPALFSPYQPPSNNSRFTILNTEDIADGGKRVYWRLEVYDLRQGFQQVGRWENNYGGVASSTLSTYYAEQGIIPFLSTGDSSFNPNLSPISIQHTLNVFDTFAIGLSSGTSIQTYLYKETSATNAALTQVTYAKGASGGITSLSSVKFVGTEYCAVGLANQGADVLSNLTTGGPTSVGTMNIATVGATGMIQTFLPGSPILICANGAILSLASTGAVTVAPSTVLASFPFGAYALGLASLGGAPVRAFWHGMSLANFSIGSINAQGGINPKGSIISTAQDGTTPQTLALPLSNVLHASLYRDGIIATDENRVIFHNGRTIRDLRVFKDVPANSDKIYKVAEFYVDGPALYAEINIIASASGTGNTQRAIWYYDFDNDAWFQVSATQTLSSTGMQSFGGRGGVSNQTGFLHMRVKDTKFWRMFHAPYAVSPFNYRKTSGAQAGTGQEYEPSGVITLTANELPGLEGMPKVIRSVQFMGDVDSGGTGGTPAKINIIAPGIDTSVHSMGDFVTGNPGKLQRRDFEDNIISFYKFQPTITVTRQSGGTDPTRLTPQFLPIAFEGTADWRPWVAPASREEVNT